MEKQKILSYAMAYLELTIEKHEEFIKNYEGDKSGLAQVSMIERYKKELRVLEHEFDSL